MAKKKSKAETGASTSKPFPWREVSWAMAVGVWLLLAAALLSFDPADPPSHAVRPMHAQPHNWVGRFGAAIAYHVLLVFGPGIWIAMTGAAAALIAVARKKPVTQLALRAGGVVIVTITTSAMIAQILPGAHGPAWSGVVPSPEGSGGLLAIFVNTELVDRFNVLGAMIILVIGFWVGALLAADHWVMAVGRGVASLLGKVKSINIPKPVLVGRFPMSSSSTAALEPRVPVRASGKRGDSDAEEPIDEDAGGLGGTTSFDPDDESAGDDEVVAEVEDDAGAPAGKDEEDEPGHDAPGAYLTEQKTFDPEALREKIKAMPINFAPRNKVHRSAMAGPGAGEVDLSGYQFPGLDLLEEPETNFTTEMEAVVREQAVALEEALQTYNIEGQVVGIDSGPVITLYEVALSPGTKVSRINAIASDLARALKAQNIRVVANMAGKDTIGIEVPNNKKERVRLKDLMTASAAETEKMGLPMFLGKDASGNPLIMDLTKMPHMLIAGTTGSGKSVCMNSIIMSFLFTKRPDELKLVLVDPKMVEMSLFRDIPHLMCPVVTEMAKAAQILEWAVTKMDERYELLLEAGVRDIASYNALGWDQLKERLQPASVEEEARLPKKLPYMVFVIDELADLMMTNKEVEHFIVRIAQKARAVGIHLILATQRPQANVVTGLIKSNMPCRIAFQVASGMDSRIVLDSKGAEVLLGQGDMLCLNPRTSKLARAQGSLVEDIEIRRVCKFLKEIAQQHFEPQLVQLRSGEVDVDEEATKDDLFEQAVRVVLESKRGSVSLLQRRLTIGYSRSSRLIEAMAAAGILGTHKGSQAREVMMSLEEWDAMRAQAEADAQAQEQDMTSDDDATGGGGEDKGVPDEIEGEYRA